jgi:hypothetical protein
MSQSLPILTYDRRYPQHPQYLWPSGRIALQYCNTQDRSGWAAFADVPIPGPEQRFFRATAQEAAYAIGAVLSENP